MTGRPLLGLVFLLTLPLVTPRIRAADEIEYYAWLRSLVFDGDCEFSNEYRYFYERDPRGLAGFKETFLDRREPVTGRAINFAPPGAALLWSPFFLLAHAGVLAARALGSTLAADGYSLPYLAAVSYSSALYAFLGLLLVHDSLKRDAGFGEPAASLSVLALWLASPVVYYMTIAPGFGHAPSLFAVALLVWLSFRAREAAGLGRWAAAGIVGGLAASIREQDVLFLAVPGGFLLLEAWRRREFGAASGRGVALAAGAAVGLLPQLLGYRALTGGFHPSTLVVRKLSWWSPHFLEVLLDPGHGLFAWSPILLLAVLGLALRLAARRDAASALLTLALVLQIWINGAIESWHLAGAFGQRRFVAATPVFAWGLALPLAALTRRYGGRAAAALVGLAVWWNLSLMAQFGLKLMDRQRLEWPRVAVAQFSEVPRHLGRAAWLFLTDRERLAKEGP